MIYAKANANLDQPTLPAWAGHGFTRARGRKKGGSFRPCLSFSFDDNDRSVFLIRLPIFKRCPLKIRTMCMRRSCRDHSKSTEKHSRSKNVLMSRRPNKVTFGRDKKRDVFCQLRARLLPWLDLQQPAGSSGRLVTHRAAARRCALPAPGR